MTSVFDCTGYVIEVTPGKLRSRVFWWIDGAESRLSRRHLQKEPGMPLKEGTKPGKREIVETCLPKFEILETREELFSLRFGIEARVRIEVVRAGCRCVCTYIEKPFLAEAKFLTDIEHVPQLLGASVRQRPSPGKM